jgi:hypothetical protein
VTCSGSDRAGGEQLATTRKSSRQAAPAVKARIEDLIALLQRPAYRKVG